MSVAIALPEMEFSPFIRQRRKIPQRLLSCYVELLESRLLFHGMSDGSVSAPPYSLSDSTLVLIDKHLIDAPLLSQSAPDARTVYFDSATESATTILKRAIHAAEIFHGRLQSIVIFSHGAAGEFELGRDLIASSTLPATSSLWATLGKQIAIGGSIDLFACNLASSSPGLLLINQIHALTDANIFASTNVTGKDGDWILEAHSSGASASDISPLNTGLLSDYPADLGLVTIQNAASATPNPVTGTTTNLSVLASDTPGSESNVTYSWAATVAPLGANPVFSINNSNAAKNTTVTFDQAGLYTFTVTATDGLFALSAVVVTVDQTLTAVSVSPASASLNENGMELFTAQGVDQFNQAMTVPPLFTWSVDSGGVGSVDLLGLYSAGATPGTATVRATSNGISGASDVTVTNAAPTVVVPATALPNPVITTNTTLSVVATDDGPLTNLTYTWSAISEPVGANPTYSTNGTNLSLNTIVTFDEAGDYTFNVAISDGSSITNSSVDVTVDQILTRASVSPASVNLGFNATQQFTGIALDQFNNPMASQPSFIWSLAPLSAGSIDSNGLYTASATAGSATVMATADLLFIGTASVTVANTPPTILVPASATPNPVDGTSTTLSVLATDDGGLSNLTYTWAATSEPNGANPIFSANGTNLSQITNVIFNEAGDYTFTVTVSDDSLNTTSSVDVTVDQTITSIVVSPAGVTLNPNSTQQFAATAFDQFNDALIVQPAFTWSIDPLGAGSIDSNGFYAAPGSSGSATVRATADLLYSGTASVTVDNSPPSILIPATAVPNPVTGTHTTLTVVADDDGGETNLTYTWTTDAAPSGANPIFSDNGTNSSQVTTVTFNEVGDYTFTVTVSDGSLTTTSSVDVTVNQTLTTVAVSPATADVAPNATQQFTATALDQFNHLLINQPTFTWSLAPLSAGTIDSNGLYTAPNSSGSATVLATTNLIYIGAASVTVDNSPPTILTPASAIPNPVNGTSTTLSVLAADDGGLTNLTYTWTATSTPPGAHPNFSNNGTSLSQVTTVTFDQAGDYTFTVTVSDGSLNTTSSVDVTVNQTLTSVSVSPSSAGLNPGATQQFTATALDQFNDPLATQPTITWSLDPLSAGTIDANGLYTAPNFSGQATVRATANLLYSSTASVTITNSPPAIVTPASATPNPVNGTTTILSVLATDDGGESNLTYIWSATSRPLGSNPSFSINGTNLSQSTTITFDQAGEYTFTVTISDGSLSTTSSVSVTVNQTVSGVLVSPSNTNLAPNSTQQFTATAFDQFNNPMATQPTFDWSLAPLSVGHIDSNGLYTAPNFSGSATILATALIYVGAAAVTVTNSPPTIVTPASATPNPVNGIFTTLSVSATDDGGQANLTYTWSATSQPPGASPSFGSNGSLLTTVTFDKAGDYTFTVTVSDGSLSTTSSVDVFVNQTLSTVAVAPQNSSLTPYSTQQFTATALDQFGDPLISPPNFTWSLAPLSPGRIDANGLYTAPAFSGTATIIATADLIFAGSSTVTISDAAPTVVLSAAASPNPVNGLHTTLSVLASDDGGEANLTYSWSATTKPAAANPNFSTNDSNSAKESVATFDMAGAYTFTVTISDGSLSTTSSIDVLVTQFPSELTVSPSSIDLSPNSVQKFSASAFDQFGNPMLTQPSVTWSIDPLGLGTIDSNGQYTAPAFTGHATVRATANLLLSATAAVTVTNQSPIIIIPAFADPDPVRRTTTTLSVFATDDGGENNLTYTWFASTAPENARPIFSANDSNTSRNTIVTFNAAGDYLFTVTVSDGSLSTTSSVAVTVVQTLSNIVISPTNTSLEANATQQFSVFGFDQFGNAITAQPAVTWSINPQDFGSIDNKGLYTAPDADGHAIIRANAGSRISAVANVDVSTDTQVVTPPTPPSQPVTQPTQPTPPPTSPPSSTPGSPPPVVSVFPSPVTPPRAVQATAPLQLTALSASSLVFSLSPIEESRSTHPISLTIYGIAANPSAYSGKLFWQQHHQNEVGHKADQPSETAILIVPVRENSTAEGIVNTSVAITTGLIAELLIPGSLLAGLFASTPAWKWFDPAPIVSASRRLRQTDENWTLEKLLQ